MTPHRFPSATAVCTAVCFVLLAGCQPSLRFASGTRGAAAAPSTSPSMEEQLASYPHTTGSQGSSQGLSQGSSQRSSQKKSSATKQTTKQPNNQPAPAPALSRQEALAQRLNGTQRTMLGAAYDWLAVPYRYGAASREGTDCSGFTLRIYEQIGILLPRSAREQSFMGSSVSRASLAPGDLLFFNTIGDSVSHVGLYVGKGTMIHASSRYGVIAQQLDAEYYERTFVAAKRVW